MAILNRKPFLWDRGPHGTTPLVKHRQASLNEITSSFHADDEGAQVVSINTVLKREGERERERERKVCVGVGLDYHYSL